jgi:hypothetical protein
MVARDRMTLACINRSLCGMATLLGLMQGPKSFVRAIFPFIFEG